MESAHARHHHYRPNLAQYRYLERRYGKWVRTQAFLATTAIIAILVGCVFVAYHSETAIQRKARFLSNEASYVRLACQFGDRVCTLAKEDSRRVVCKLYPEDCPVK